jgi:uncharacterized protein YeaO (DUF488 family)
MLTFEAIGRIENAMRIAVKRVYEPPAQGDGKRILVDRLWPRGLAKTRAALDDWIKAVAPSPGLRKWFDHRPERFAEFRRRYRRELSDNPALGELRAAMGRGKVTLLYGAKDPRVNHAVVLAEFLRKAK